MKGRAKPPAYIITGGQDPVHAFLVGFAVDVPPSMPDGDDDDGGRGNEAIIAVEYSGARTLVKAVSRALGKGEHVAISYEDQYGRARRYRYRLAAPASGFTFLVATLPGGWVHALCLHPQAVLTKITPGADFYVIEPRGGSEDRRLTHFLSALDESTPIPLFPHWAGWLWDEGEADGLITPVRTVWGLAAWRISGNADAWADVLRRGISSGVLGVS